MSEDRSSAQRPAPFPGSSIDISTLPREGFGSASTPWWGTLGFIAAEGGTLLLCAGTYLYLARNFDEWPPAGLGNPDLFLPTLSLLLLVASIVPARWLSHAARRMNLRAVTRLLVLAVGIEVVLVTLRAFEFAAVNVRWDTNAYGSAVWFTLGIHSLLLLTDLFETAVFALIFLTGRAEEKHFTDAADVALYWHFVALSWVPLYALIYLSPRLL